MVRARKRPAQNREGDAQRGASAPGRRKRKPAKERHEVAQARACAGSIIAALR
jgi:hypothetical protein